MQGDIERSTYGSFMETASVISKSGFTAFYRGATFRYGRMCCAVCMMDYLQVSFLVCVYIVLLYDVCVYVM